MPRDPQVLIWDARRSVALVRQFTSGKSLDDYQADVFLRSAVERQLMIIGEALHQLARVDPEVASRIVDLPGIIAVRNIIVHGYATLDNLLVWAIVGEDLQTLERSLDEVGE